MTRKQRLMLQRIVLGVAFVLVIASLIVSSMRVGLPEEEVPQPGDAILPATRALSVPSH